ncbi:MAG: hypothetical protein A2076_08315 [Geobacteraceae bacterium GWC2_53_11]|nr:MAG: hypothetical protein A2076_08315 [Geobacteraceae bacterium GWC2_53_11]
MRLTLITFSLVVASAVSASAAHKVTFYRDGALHQQEAAALKGVIQVPLAADLLEQTLTVIPVPGTTILSVETQSSGAANPADKELETLAEQRRRLEDRLQALETRETIFTSAAKSQSGKAPRKTKANPDPLQAIRQGTDYAIAQLEAVYTARRKATQEMAKIDSRMASVRKSNQPADRTVRIAVTPSRGKVTLRYGTTERGWLPQYNLHLAGDGSAQLQLTARITGGGQGRQLRVSSGSLSESSSAETLPAHSSTVLLASYRLPLANEQVSEGLYNRFSGTITNSSARYLPPGESGLFRNGSYVGKFVFEGLSSGRSRVISLGR